jgi:hypothetical protein
MFKADCVMIFLPIQLCLWIAGHLKALVPDPSTEGAQTATPEVEMQMTDALLDYGTFVLTPPPQPKGNAKGSKRSAPGNDAPLPSTKTHDEEAKLQKILRRTLTFTGPALLCTDAQLDYSFPFHISKNQREFMGAWTEQQLRSSNAGIRTNTVLNTLDTHRTLSIPVQFAKVPIFSVSTSEEPAPVTRYTHPTQSASNKGMSKGKANQPVEKKKEAKGHGDLADLSKLNKVFGGEDISFLLSVPDSPALLLDGLDEQLQEHLQLVFFPHPSGEPGVSSVRQDATPFTRDFTPTVSPRSAAPQSPRTAPSRNFNPYSTSQSSTDIPWLKYEQSSWDYRQDSSSNWSSNWWTDRSNKREPSWTKDSSKQHSSSWQQDKRKR